MAVVPYNNDRRRKPTVQCSYTILLTEEGDRRISILESELNKWNEELVDEIKSHMNARHEDAPIIEDAMFSPRIFAGNIQSAPGLNTVVASLCNVELFNNIDQERIRNNWSWTKTIKKILKRIMPAAFLSIVGDVSIAGIRGAIAEVLDKTLTQAGLCPPIGTCLVDATVGAIGGCLIMKMLHLIYLLVKKGWQHFKEQGRKYFYSKQGWTDVKESFKELWPKDRIGWVKYFVGFLASIAITALVPTVWQAFLITAAVGFALYLIFNAIKLGFSGEYDGIWDFIKQTFWPRPGMPYWKKPNNSIGYDPYEIGHTFEELFESHNPGACRSITFVCSISMDLMCNPTFSQCREGHVFDQIYLQRHFKSLQSQELPVHCPTCRENVPFVEGEWKSATKHKKIIDEIAKRCEFKKGYRR
jgi:hypothetical protein